MSTTEALALQNRINGQRFQHDLLMSHQANGTMDATLVAKLLDDTRANIATLVAKAGAHVKS